MPIPAIDLLGGKAVRLAGGARESAKVYEHRPVTLAARFADSGAHRVHVVDLNGAFGEPRQIELLRALVREARSKGLEVEIGGGIHSREAAAAVLGEVGADFAVIGTLAVRDPETARALCGEFPGRIIVAIDGRDGRVAVAGWRELSETPIPALAAAAQRWGAAAVLYTDIERDGLQGGPAVAATAALQAELAIPVIASGGVGSLADLEALRDADVRAVIIGRALYEGSFTLEEALARC